MERIAALHADPPQATLLGLWATVVNFRAWESPDEPCPVQSLRDSERNWLGGSTPIDDL